MRFHGKMLLKKRRFSYKDWWLKKDFKPSRSRSVFRTHISMKEYRVRVNLVGVGSGSPSDEDWKPLFQNIIWETLVIVQCVKAKKASKIEAHKETYHVVSQNNATSMAAILFGWGIHKRGVFAPPRRSRWAFPRNIAKAERFFFIAELSVQMNIQDQPTRFLWPDTLIHLELRT